MTNKYILQILKWAGLGLLIRIALMPFTMHGQDILFINYFPMMFVTKGAWDPYGFIAANFPHFPYTYYGPVLFCIISLANFVYIRIFHCFSLVKMLELSSTMMFKHYLTEDYVYAFANLGLFKNLFIMKIPYLIFDFVIAALLLKLATSESPRLKSYKLWMLNIVVLHSTYATGGFDVIVAFFVIAALYACAIKRPYLAVILSSLGGGTKLLPYVLLVPISLLMGRSWRERLRLIFVGSFVAALVYLPFYLSSGSSAFGFFGLSKALQYSGYQRFALFVIFACCYALIMLYAVKDSNENPEKKALYYFTVIIFLFFTTFPTRLRYFIAITPLLALIIPGRKKFGIFILALILMLAFSQSVGRHVQMALFAPINPGYFSRIPSIQEIAGRYINIEVIYKILARLSLLSFFIAAGWVWKIKLKET